MLTTKVAKPKAISSTFWFSLFFCISVYSNIYFTLRFWLAAKTFVSVDVHILQPRVYFPKLWLTNKYDTASTCWSVSTLDTFSLIYSECEWSKFNILSKCLLCRYVSTHYTLKHIFLYGFDDFVPHILIMCRSAIWQKKKNLSSAPPETIYIFRCGSAVILHKLFSVICACQSLSS